MSDSKGKQKENEAEVAREEGKSVKAARERFEATDEPRRQVPLRPAPQKLNKERFAKFGTPKNGYDVASRRSLRILLDYKLPRSAELQEAVDQELADPTHSPPPRALSDEEQQQWKEVMIRARRRGPRLTDLPREKVRMLGERGDFEEERKKQKRLAEKQAHLQEVLDHQKEFREFCSRYTCDISNLDPAERKELEETLARAAKDLADAATKKAHPKVGLPAEMIIKLEKIVNEATRIGDHIADLLDAVANDETNQPKTLAIALSAKVRGIRFADLETDRFNDDNLSRTRLTRENFAGGAVNQVSELAYDDPSGDKGETRIFKPEAVAISSRERAFQVELFNTLGIDKSAPRIGNRNVASSVIAKLLGTGAICDTCFTIHNGEIGISMAKAPGVKVTTMQTTLEGPPPPPKLSKDSMGSVQSQLNALEWTDMLTGQSDRHPDNYMVDVDPKTGTFTITGIDNDFAFGKRQSAFAKYGPEDDLEQVKAYWRKMDYKSAQKPVLIDSKTYESLVAIVDQEAFNQKIRPSLEHRLNDEEINATFSRFKEMRDLAISLHPEFVVRDWATWASPPIDGERLSADAYLRRFAPLSLFARDFSELSCQ